MSQQAQLTTPEAACLFIFAGNATVTLRSKVTGSRFTYKVRESDDGSVFFVSVLNGPDNWQNYQYIGQFRGPDYSHGRKSKVSPDAPSAKAFAWFALRLRAGIIPDVLEVWHEGRCGACGRKLTVPESIATGLGPECSDRLGVARVRCDDPSALQLALAS